MALRGTGEIKAAPPPLNMISGKEGELGAALFLSVFLWVSALLPFQHRRDPRSAGKVRDNEVLLDHLFMPDEVCMFAYLRGFLTAPSLFYLAVMHRKRRDRSIAREETWNNNTGVT